MQKERITTLLFDLDGTLRFSVPEGREVFLDFLQKKGIEIKSDSLREFVQWTFQYWANSECLVQDKHTYNTEDKAFWRNYARRQLAVLGIENGSVDKLAAEAHEYIQREFSPEDLIPQEIYATLANLQEAGYVLGLVTNRSQPIDDYLHEKNLKEFFHFYFTAGEIARWKPDARIFQHALDLAGARPSQALYIGDNYFADVLGARNAAIEPILVDPENFFPLADCKVIKQVSELPQLLA